MGRFLSGWLPSGLLLLRRFEWNSWCFGGQLSAQPEGLVWGGVFFAHLNLLLSSLLVLVLRVFVKKKVNSNGNDNGNCDPPHLVFHILTIQSIGVRVFPLCVRLRVCFSLAVRGPLAERS